jgi:peptide/nickel transport system ATP-binding protein
VARIVLLLVAAAEIALFALAIKNDGLNDAGTLSFAAGAIGSGLATVLVWLLPPSIADYKNMVDVRAQHEAKVNEVLEAVGIDPEAAVNRRPHEFSGGQCQRICIARSLVLDPKLIICDEPVSALDVSVQAQILNLLEDMKQRYGLTLVFIAHDLAVVKNVSDRVAVMYLGKLCEVAPPDDLYAKPAHPYTAALLGAIPVPDPTYRPDLDAALAGEIPSPVAPPSGCRFRTRCPKAEDMCTQVEPKMRQIGLGHHVACHFPIELSETQRKPAKLAQGQRS